MERPALLEHTAPIARPTPSEHDDYYRLYIDQVPEGDVLGILAASLEATLDRLRDLPKAWQSFRYEPDKWTINEVIGHVIDVERTFAYRAMCMARGEQRDLPIFDQDTYAAASNAASRPLAALLGELVSVRRASLTLFASFDDAALGRAGKASGFPFTVRTFPFLIAGHEIHHRRVIEERYLPAMQRIERDGASS